MLFSTLAQRLEEIRQSLADHDQVAGVLTRIFRQAKPHEIEIIVRLCLGGLASHAAYSDSHQCSTVSLLEPVGIAEPHTVASVYDEVCRILQSRGPARNQREVNLVASLEPTSAELVDAALDGRLFQLDKHVIIEALSLAKARNLSLVEPIARINRAILDLGYVAQVLWEKGEGVLRSLVPQVGVPFRPMKHELVLVDASNPDGGRQVLRAAWQKLGSCYVEPKLHGYRIQIHKDGEDVRLFTPGLHDWTNWFPSVVEGVRTGITSRVAILDSEVLGYDASTRTFLPEEQTRGAPRHKAVIFDTMLLEHESCLERPYEERRRLFIDIVKDVDSGTLVGAEGVCVDTFDDFFAFYMDCLAKGFEGLIAKKLDGLYKPGVRSTSQLKVKPFDAVDAVVLGFDVGTSQSEQVSVASFLVGVHRDDRQEYVAIGKVSRASSDETWKTLFRRADELKIRSLPPNVETGFHPDVFVKPEMVVEIRGYGLMPSEYSTCGRDERGLGYLLRGARLIRVRDDKGVEDATTESEFLKIRAAPGHKVSKGAIQRDLRGLSDSSLGDTQTNTNRGTSEEKDLPYQLNLFDESDM